MQVSDFNSNGGPIMLGIVVHSVQTLKLSESVFVVYIDSQYLI